MIEFGPESRIPRVPHGQELRTLSVDAMRGADICASVIAESIGKGRGVAAQGTEYVIGFLDMEGKAHLAREGFEIEAAAFVDAIQTNQDLVLRGMDARLYHHDIINPCCAEVTVHQAYSVHESGVPVREIVATLVPYR